MKTPDLTIGEILNPSAYAEWDAFVNAQPLSTIFHLSAWNRIAEKVYGIANAIIVSRAPDGSIRAGTPVFFAKRPGSWYVTSGIFGSYGPILVREGEEHRDGLREVLDGAVEYARARRVKYIHLKGLEGPKGKNDFLHPSYERQDIWVTAFKNISGTREELWKSLPGPMRTKVRKAEKSELSTHWGSAPSDLAEFYEVLADNMHRKGSPIYGQAFMEAILEEFHEERGGKLIQTEASILTLRLSDAAVIESSASETAATDGSAAAQRVSEPNAVKSTTSPAITAAKSNTTEEIVSGAIVLRHAGVVYVPFVSSRAKYFPLRPNNLLYWEIIRDGNQRGMEWLDFGTSIRGASTLQFKESWGAKTYPVVSYVYSESGEKIRLDAGSSSVQIGVEIWKKLPRRTADWLGPKLSAWMV